MACSNCQNNNSSVSVFDIQYIYNSNCSDCNTICNGNITDAKCVGYFGPNLTCSAIATNDSLELALQKIDEILCSTSGNYSTYNIHCLSGPITTESQFVSVISEYVCNLRSDFDDFKDVEYVQDQADLDGRFDNIEVPGITCSSASVVNTDTLQQVLNKYCTKFSQIDANISVDSVDWDQCFTVVTPPTNVHEGFDLLIDQICQIKTTADAGATLPTFNNVGSCLPSPGAADSLVDTVGKIKTRLCQTGVFTTSGMTWGCVAPGTDLQTTVQNTITKVSAITALMPTFDGSDFNVEAVDEEDPCAGVIVSLATPINQDRYVASNNIDTSPGTLADKLEAGTNISLDYLTTPGKVIVNNTGGVGDHKVLASSIDDTPDYLDEKLNGITGINGLSVDASYNATTKQVDIAAFLDMSEFFTSFVNYLNTNPDQKTIFCNLMATCPSPCAQPQNVSVVYISGGETTTTTTTSTSTTTTTTTTP